MITQDDLNSLLYQRLKAGYDNLNTPLSGGVFKEQLPPSSHEKENVLINTLSISHDDEGSPIVVTSYVTLVVPQRYFQTEAMWVNNYARENVLQKKLCEVIANIIIPNVNVWLAAVDNAQSNALHCREFVCTIKWLIPKININIR